MVARGLCKAYTIAHNQEKHSTLAESMLHRLRRPFERAERETFWALDDVSFDIKKGDVVGIIGRNGAGKSTLLKILSRITEPTKGEIRLYGRVGSLLEVGTGFHPELTGRENVYLNGQILGMRKKEIDKQFDAIVDFAGVEQFLDTPVKRYSSGMYVRLAFAVAAHLSSEILVVDEVLAVGDQEFQRKCMGKIRNVASCGRTVLFVSHHMQSIRSLCEKAIYLDRGKIGMVGASEAVIDWYLKSPSIAIEVHRPKRQRKGNITIEDVYTEHPHYRSTSSLVIFVRLRAREDRAERVFLSLHINNGSGACIFHLDSRLLNQEFSFEGVMTVRYMIEDPRLAHGEYSVDAYVCSSSGVLDQTLGCSRFSVAPILPYPSTRGDCAAAALIYPEFSVEAMSIGQSVGG